MDQSRPKFSWQFGLLVRRKHLREKSSFPKHSFLRLMCLDQVYERNSKISTNNKLGKDARDLVMPKNIMKKQKLISTLLFINFPEIKVIKKTHFILIKVKKWFCNVLIEERTVSKLRLSSCLTISMCQINLC